jgi:AsmA protein
MRPFLKWLLLGGAALLVLAVAIVIAVVTLVDPARYRTLVVDAVQRSTGRTLTLAGDVGLKLLPCCAIELQQASLGNPPGFPAEPFLRVESAQLGIRLWPLLTRREVEIGTVRITGLQASLLGRKDGSNNWSFSEVAGSAGPDTAGGGGPGVTSFRVAGIELRDARVDYSDEADGSRYRVGELQLTTGPVSGGEPFDLSTSFRLTDLTDNSGGTFQLKARTRLARGDEATVVSLAGLEGEADTRGLAGLTSLGGRFRAPAVDVRLADDTLLKAPDLGIELQLAGPDLPGGTLPLQATLKDLDYAVDAGRGTIAGLTASATVAGVALDLDGKGYFGTSSDLRGTLRFPAFSPRDVLPKLNLKVPDTADPTVLKSLSGAAGWFLNERQVGLSGLKVKLDDTQVAGNLSRERLPAGSKATPRTRFDLTIDALDADRYLGSDEPPAKAADGTPAPAKPTEIPAETLRGLNLEGRARIGRLTIDKLRLADVDVTTSAAGGRLRLEPLAARLYGGTFRGGIRLDATGPKARLGIDQTFSSVDFGALLTEFADVKNITGTMSLKLDGTAVGASDDELLASLGGNLAFTLADGVYKGMDVWYEIRRARALLRRTSPPERAGPEETPIRLLDMAGKLTSGELRTERFTAEIPFIRVSGDAVVNLPRGTLDSKLSALVFEKPVFGDDTSLEELVNARIPFTVSGPVRNPKVRVDIGNMVKGALKETLRETLKGPVRQSLEEKLRERLGLGQPAETAPPADGDQAAPAAPPPEDPLKKALDRLFKKGTGP